jgi:phosphohistidine phosphatase
VLLVIVRHAAAVERGVDGVSDAERQLTARGRDRFREAARGLARIVSAPDLLLSSPLVRALQTAEIAAETWGAARPVLEPTLADGTVADVLAAVAQHTGLATVAVFGHEPQLASLVARLIGLSQPAPVSFKKGGVALIETADPLAQEPGRLVAFLPPRVLRALGGGGGDD